MDVAQEVTNLLYQIMPPAEDQGLYVSQIDLPQVTCIMPFQPHQLRPGNTLSGPTMMTLADVCMYALVLAIDEHQKMAVTQDLQIHFLARPEPKDLVGIATALKIGRRSIVMRVDLYSGDRLVAHATGSYALDTTLPTST
ncbi:MAG: PaaI family thioesterase [Pseudomonadota bacterium]|nr:PaaI family thioesterase [Pseudomonadota bacterium]